MKNEYDRTGQSIVEYAIILVLIAVNVILVLQITGVNLREVYCRVAGGLGGGACQVYCSDQFDNLNNWTKQKVTGTGWEIKDGGLCIYSAGEQQISNKCSASNDLPKDYLININVATLYAGNGYGVYFRMKKTNPIEGYAFQYDPGLGGAYVIRKWVNGWEVNPYLGRVVVPAGYQWYNKPRKIQIYVRGTEFKVHVDDNLVMTVNDSTYDSGGVGFRSWDSTQACFDDFSITRLP